MKAKTSKNVMKGVSATLAVCSALAMVSATKPATFISKKAVRKTADKVTDIIDSLSSFM